MAIKMTILIIVLVIVMLIVLYICWRPSTITDNGTIYNYNTNIRPKLKTGDIILFSSKNNGSAISDLMYKTRTSLLGTDYGHVGLVVRNPSTNKLYLIECTDYGHTAHNLARVLNDKKRGGIRIIDLDTIIDRYGTEQNGLFAVKFIETEIPYKTITKILPEYQNVVFENKLKLITLAITDLMLSHQLAAKISGSGYRGAGKYSFGTTNSDTNSDTNPRKMMCSEFVYEILYRCGAVRKYDSRLVWPHDYTTEMFQSMSIVNFSRPYVFVK